MKTIQRMKAFVYKIIHLRAYNDEIFIRNVTFNNIVQNPFFDLCLRWAQLSLEICRLHSVLMVAYVSMHVSK